MRVALVGVIIFQIKNVEAEIVFVPITIGIDSVFYIAPSTLHLPYFFNYLLMLLNIDVRKTQYHNQEFSILFGVE